MCVSVRLNDVGKHPASPTYPWCCQNQTCNKCGVSGEALLLAPPWMPGSHTLSSSVLSVLRCLGFVPCSSYGSHLCPLGLSCLLCPLPSHMVFSPLTSSCAGHSCFLIPWWVSCCLLLSHCSWSSLIWYSWLFCPLWCLSCQLLFSCGVQETLCHAPCLCWSCLIRNLVHQPWWLMYHVIQCKMTGFLKRTQSCFIYFNYTFYQDF